MMVDRDLVTRKLLLILADLERLEYEAIDTRRLHESLRPARDDIAAWVAAVQRYLKHRSQ